MPKTDTSRLIAAFPHLANISGAWGTRECRQRINRLMTDTRGGARGGFPPEHASALVSLLVEHDRDFPAFDDSARWLWWESSRRGLVA
ncbi:hypothetical protein E6C76_13925 [Pseudothauera nasutitermitis]|uniref:Uncharacterized protein n=1 Tax=Pseudothauera nasutitermitis TaxID=2565930 RepID=A0A4S4AYI3_9RHOO|nr:hypothetical protein [Pseudothauera nasutitermitis]THF63682.1 hypothetical protein E6C76_13925 [Pseudothauera nasutitermitis]